MPEISAAWMLDAFVPCITLPEDCRHHRVPDNSMAPLVREGDWVTVDVEDRMPSPPGLFLLWRDRDGLALRNVEVLANSEPPLVRIGGVAPSMGDEVTPAADAGIEGRVRSAWRVVDRAQRY